MKQSDVGNCNDRYCEYYNEGMELNCSYSIDNSKCIKTKKPITSDAVLAEVRAIADKYGRWERVMKGGKYIAHKVITKRSWDKMLRELNEHFR